MSTKEAREYLIRQGEPKDKVKVMSFPLNKKFFEKVTRSREEILNELGLDPGRKTLWQPRRQGIGDTSSYVKKLYKSEFPFNIIAVCGKNRELFDEFSKLKDSVKSEVPLAVLGFVDNMHELLEASDLAIAKGGLPLPLRSWLSVPTIFTHCAALQKKAT